MTGLHLDMLLLAGLLFLLSMKSHRRFCCAVCLLPVLLLSGCAEQKTSKTLRDFMKETIVLPDDLLSIHERNVSAAPDFKATPIQVIYHDSLACSTCQITHLTDNLGLYERADTSSFQVVTVFSPRQEEYDEVVRQLMILDFPYPIYVDFSGSFRRRNTGIPEDVRFHSFLIDKDGCPVFVGNPASSEDLWKLFDKVLSTRY